MLVIGLTGGIACGKSTLAQALREMGVPVLDADQISRELTRPGGGGLAKIRRAFGEKVFAPDGSLDRKALASLVFSNEESRSKLNAILHPMVLEQMEKATAAWRKKGAAAVVWDVPLLFETGMDKLCGLTWCAYVPQKEQIRRLAARDGMTRKEALARIRSQAPMREKRRLASRVIDTRGPLEDNAQKIRQLYWEAVAGHKDSQREETDCNP